MKTVEFMTFCRDPAHDKSFAVIELIKRLNLVSLPTDPWIDATAWKFAVEDDQAPKIIEALEAIGVSHITVEEYEETGGDGA